MYKYYVETVQGDLSWLYAFDADDLDHAIEQARNAWPDEEIVMVKKGHG